MVRADESGRDEFSLFGKYVNEFLGKLAGVIQTAQNISEKVKYSGDELDSMAKGSSVTSSEISKAVEDISSGADCKECRLSGQRDGRDEENQQGIVCFYG